MKVCKYNDTLALRCFLSLDQIFQIFLSSLNSFEAVPATQSTFKICPVAWSKKSIPHSTWTIFFKCICIRGAWFYRSIFEALGGVEYIFSRITTLNSAFFGRASVWHKFGESWIDRSAEVIGRCRIQYRLKSKPLGPKANF